MTNQNPKIVLDNHPHIMYNKGTKRKELTTMKYYHIIEETTDQQTVEVFAETLSEALGIYFHFSTNETPRLITISTHHDIITYYFPSETCTITKQSEQLVFAKWKHNKGLY